jgi:hypothetical protein
MKRCLSTYVALVMMVGCARQHPPPDLSLDPAALLDQASATQRKIVRVAGNARVHVETPAIKGTVQEFVAAEKPDRLHLETMDFFGNVAAVLVADGSRFAFYDAKSATFYEGAPTPQNISKLLPIVIPASELATILCGSAPILEGKPLSARAHDGQVELVIAGGPGGELGQQLLIGEEAAIESSKIRRARISPEGKMVQDAPAYDLALSLFRHRAGVRFPTELALQAPAAHVSMGLVWKEDLAVNGPAQPALFQMNPPKGAKVVKLEPGAEAPAVELPVQRE